MRLGLRACTPALVLFALGCSGGDDSDAEKSTNDATNGSGGSGTSTDSNTNGSGGSSSSNGSGGSVTSGNGSGNTGDSTTGSSGGSESTGNNQTATTGISPIPGDPGCGLESAAFCDTFDERSGVRGRAGELDPRLWSVTRGQPQLPTGDGMAYTI